MSMTREELLRRADKIQEYFDIRGWGYAPKMDGEYNRDAISRENLEKCDDMVNFTLEFIDLLEKYKVKIYTINSMITTFGFNVEGEDKELYIAADYFWECSKLRRSEEELDKEMERLRRENGQ